jgi:hypothetical protein
MAIIKDLQEQLLTGSELKPFAWNEFSTSGTLIIVLKNYRFHKQLSIELYEASFSQAGKVKNPLTPVNPLDAVLKVKEPGLIRYFSAISRFQNNPTAARSPLDIEALRTVIKNPLGLRMFYHDPGFSENVVAGSLQEVAAGGVINDLALLVNKKNDTYVILPQVVINGKVYDFNDLEVKYDYFILVENTIHLLGNFHLLKVVRFFYLHKAVLRLHGSEFREFREQVLDQLEQHVSVCYAYVQAATT